MLILSSSHAHENSLLSIAKPTSSHLPQLAHIVYVYGHLNKVYYDFKKAQSQTKLKIYQKKIEYDIFRLITSVGQRKIPSPHEESNLRPSDAS